MSHGGGGGHSALKHKSEGPRARRRVHRKAGDVVKQRLHETGALNVGFWPGCLTGRDQEARRILGGCISRQGFSGQPGLMRSREMRKRCSRQSRTSLVEVEVQEGVRAQLSGCNAKTASEHLTSFLILEG